MIPDPRMVVLHELLGLPDPPDLPLRSHRWTQEGADDQTLEAIKGQLARSFRQYRQMEIRG